MFNIIDLVRKALTPEVVSGLSAVTGETPSATSRAVGLIGPAIGAGLIGRGSTPGGAAERAKE